MFNKIEQELGRKIPDALKKLSGRKWEWKSEVGEWFFSTKHELCLITTYGNDKGDFIEYYYYGEMPYDEIEIYAWKWDHTYVESEKFKTFIPLLHWERQLEPILKGMGYTLTMYTEWRVVGEKTMQEFIVEIDKERELLLDKGGKTRQEAVQRAVLALVEEQKQ